MSQIPPITEAEVDRQAALVGLVIDPAHRPVVAQQLTGLLAAAQLFADFPLTEDVEPAPEFRP